MLESQDTLKYTIVGDDIAQQFFYLNADTGLLTLKRLLTEDDSTQYNVRETKMIISATLLK